MRILYDFDGTIANLHKPWLEAYNNDFNDNVSSSDILDWDIRKFIKPEAHSKIFKYINEPNFYKKVEPIDDLLSEMQIAHSSGIEVGICTSCSSNINMMQGKLWWLNKHAKFIPKSNILFVDNKGLARADILIDDRVLNIEAFLESNPYSAGEVVRWAHNRKEIERVKADPKFKNRITVTKREYP